ncbi:hypothetical protein D1831_14390, partial [Lactiplantibacillus garii]
YSNLTKGVFGYHTWKNSMELSNSTANQEIYKARYIGYFINTDDGGNYLLTKAQNKKQKVIFSK